MPMGTVIRTEQMTSARSQLHLMQLISPNLPIGAFTYSQGLEYAVERRWVRDFDSFEDWLTGLLQENLTYIDIPVLKRIYEAVQKRDSDSLLKWCQYLLASRESSELRLEEIQRAKAMTKLLRDLKLQFDHEWSEPMQLCQACPYALACVRWSIPIHQAMLGYAWGWLENQVAAGIKLVPLGQTDGQCLQLALSNKIPGEIEKSLNLKDEDLGASAVSMAIASSLHETQYTRLFRS